LKPPEKPKPPIRIPTEAENKANRQRVLEAGGAIAWRQGKIGGKDRWDTIVNPYSKDADYVMVLGDKPEGATIVARGVGSAYATAQMLRGKPPSKVVTVDSGFQDITITPKGEKRISLHFTPDPKGLTKGDITIGRPGIRPPAPPRRGKISKPPAQRSGLYSKKRGKIYYTKMRGGTAMSRRDLGIGVRRW